MIFRRSARFVTSRFLPEPGYGRQLTLVTAIHGQGLWAAISAIYATTVVGLSAGQFGAAVAIAAAASLISSAPTGELADRVGPRKVLVCSLIALGPITALLLAANSFAWYAVVLAAQAIVFGASRGARMAMIAALVPAQERVRLRAYLRSATNVSIAVGAMIGGFVLSLNNTTCYRVAVVAVAVTYLTSGLMTLRLPSVPAQPARRGPRLVVLRDAPYLTLVVLDGILSMHNLLLDVVLPLWVIERTSAPRWIVAAVLLVNTIAVVLLQVRASHGTDEVAGAARAVRIGGLFVALGCLAFAFSNGSDVVMACLLLVLGAGLHVYGEVRQSSGSWGISFGLAPDHAQGQYQGTYAMAADIGKVLGPGLLVWLAISFGRGGWIVMAIAFLIVGALFPPIASWAERESRAKQTIAA
ncbi:MAG: MFS transporter [Actinomycetota bacterium]|nr:MFS transporter [Actinomycetota bacterium]